MDQKTEEKALYDSREFIESLLGHLYRDPEVLKLARSIQLRGDDFVASDNAGIAHYRVMANIALGSSEVPVPRSVTMLMIKARIADGQISSVMLDDVCRLYESMYTVPMHAEFMKEHMPKFMKYRRESRALMEHGADADKLYNQLQKIREETARGQVSQVQALCPFEKLVRPMLTKRIRTGVGHLNEKMGGLAYGEMGFILGFSGAGKTAYCCNLLKGLTIMGAKTIYATMEEPEINIAHRVYSNYFELNYTDLHEGRDMELVSKFNEMDPQRRALFAKNLRIIDLRDRSPINTEQMKQVLEAEFKKDGFYPDVLIIDQLGYMEPNAFNEKEDRWQRLEKVSFDCDKLSEYKVDGKYPLSLIVQHQIKGEPKLCFGVKDIAGFTGILRPADWGLGLGRENARSEIFSLFSLKVRHCSPFVVGLKGELGSMRFKRKESDLEKSDVDVT